MGYNITTLNFPKKWGLGTSSTLINNIAQWLQIDAFTLLNSFGGSGYDIACAQYLILYHLKGKPIVDKVSIQVQENIYFVYLNKNKVAKQQLQTIKITKRKI
jgi:hypothetical protein